MRTDKWKKEQDARVKLMYEVYDSRGDDIKHKSTFFFF